MHVAIVVLNAAGVAVNVGIVALPMDVQHAAHVDVEVISVRSMNSGWQLNVGLAQLVRHWPEDLAGPGFQPHWGLFLTKDLFCSV